MISVKKNGVRDVFLCLLPRLLKLNGKSLVNVYLALNKSKSQFHQRVNEEADGSSIGERGGKPYTTFVSLSTR